MMKKNFARGIFILTSLVFIFSTLTGSEGLDEEILQGHLNDLVERKINYGVVVGIVDESGSRFIQAGTYREGDDRPVDKNTVFAIGSLTSVFTAILSLELMIDKELDIEIPVNDYLPPEAQMGSYEGEEISIKHLLAHCSGLPSQPDNFRIKNRQDPFSGYTAENFYTFLSKWNPKIKPGTLYSSSDLGYTVITYAITAKTGENYETLVKAKVFNPLDMERTSVELDSRQKYRLARGHHGVSPQPLWNPGIFAGAMGLRSTPEDMAHFLEANLFNKRKSSLEKAMQIALTPMIDTGVDGTIACLGWHQSRFEKKNLFWQVGLIGGYSSFIGLDKQGKRGVVVMSNSNTALDPIGFHVLDPTVFKLPLFTRGKELLPEDMDKYTGAYKFLDSETSFLLVIRKGDALFAQTDNQPRYRMVYTGEDTFSFDFGANLYLSFKRSQATKEQFDIVFITKDDETRQAVRYR